MNKKSIDILVPENGQKWKEDEIEEFMDAMEPDNPLRDFLKDGQED